MPEPSSLAGLAEEIRRGALSPLELVDRCLARIRSRDGVVKAFVHVDEEGALRTASALTEELDRGEPRSLLPGVPVAVKDMIDVAGMPTRAASKVLSYEAGADAPVVAALRGAGAVVVGKTNCDEFALGVVSEPTRNPWDPDRVPGGSSGGSAAAVAAGMVPLALGTDTAGSVRIPAGLCGVSALKPRGGGAPVEGVVPLAPSFDSVGPIAATVDDVARAWEVMSGAAPPDPAPDAIALGVVGAAALGEVSAEVAAAYDEATAAFEATVTIEVPAFGDFRRPSGLVLLAEALEVHSRRGWWPEREHLYSENLAANLRYAGSIDGPKLEAARADLSALCARFLEGMAGVDAVLVPTTPRTAPSVGEVAAEATERLSITQALIRLTGPVNALPLAAVTVPWSLAGGLPVGIDVVARDEATALAVARRVAAAAPGVGAAEVAGA